METTLTREAFENLPEDAVVRVTYSSRYVSDFRQDFTRRRAVGAVWLSSEDWAELWDTYHDGVEVTTTFTLISE